MELTQGNVTMRVDGDVFEVLTPNNTTRVPLDRLQVRLNRAGKSAYLIAIGQSRYVDKDRQPLPPGPLYSFGDMSALGKVGGTKLKIDPEEEPHYRTFFAGLAPLCDDREVQEPPAEKETRGLFGHRTR